LLDHIVNLISEKFNFYHAGIFLLDDAEKYAILRAASSEGGHRMLARGHRLEVGQVGIVGYVAGKAEPRIALDVGKDAVFFNNPDLPQTRSEMALPLKARGRVIGVLDVQSTRGGAFVDEDVAVLQILADQVALAIENSRLIHESQQSLRELETMYQQQVARAWKQRLAEHEITYIYDPLGVRPAVPGTQLSTGQTGNGHTLQVPIQLRGQALGTLILRRDAMQPAFRAEEIELVKTAISQVALTLDNARLLEENRRRALTEQTIGQITSRAQTSLDLDTVIKTAVQEIGLALGSARVQIRLTTEEQQPGGEAAAFHNNASSQDTRS
jgi:GAF domain-containing protein